MPEDPDFVLDSGRSDRSGQGVARDGPT